jgi:hypothetical protein
LQFTLGRQTVSASGTCTDDVHTHVLRLHIHRTPRDEFLHGIISHFPTTVLRWLTALFPRWTLPRTFILKKQKPDWDEESENEKRMYAKLTALQDCRLGGGEKLESKEDF